jgi:hypothetical protein
MEVFRVLGVLKFSKFGVIIKHVKFSFLWWSFVVRFQFI